MLNINLDNEMEKLIQLCETPIEEELFSKIIKFVIKSSFFFNTDIESKCYKLTILREVNIDIETLEEKYSEIEWGEYIYLGVRIDYSGYYEKEFTRYIEIIPQYKFIYKVDDDIYGLPIKNKELRLDFGVFLKDYKTDKLIKKFCIECDGYEYHSSQEKIRNDNSRDMLIITEGDFHTIRYLGTQINRMNTGEIDTLLDALFIEKTKEFDYNFYNKGLDYTIDERGIKWYITKNK